jgi:C1A family cysteine protease
MTLPLGYLPDPPDERDYRWDDTLGSRLAREDAELSRLSGITTPRVLLDCLPPIHNQKNTNSCVANATVAALEILRIKVMGRASHADLSRLHVYFRARELAGPSQHKIDGGTFIRNAFHVIRNLGICEERFWPFDPNKVNVRPPLFASMKSFGNRIQSFYRIQEEGKDRVSLCVEALKQGHPVVFGTRIGEEWSRYKAQGKKTSPLRLPSSPKGGHAVVLVGYDSGVFTGLNSWGGNWGDNGLFYLHPEVIESTLSRDFWVPTGPYVGSAR